MIVPADKGRETVVMDKDDYVRKNNSHLSDGDTYAVLASNPTDNIRNGMNQKLKQLKAMKQLSEEEYKTLYSNTNTIARFYGTIKTHKPNYPIRPIVSFIGTPTYQLAKYLSKIITPTSNLAPQKLKNT